MDLNEILIFAKVVQAGSFTAASRELAMPKSTVSRKVAALEERLGTRLLQRTTRQLRLTEVGQAFYQHASRVVAEAEEAEWVVGQMQEVPRGLLRVTAPINFGFLRAIVGGFLQRYPEVQLELVCTDRLVDLIHDGFDVAVRAGPLADSALVVRTLAAFSSYAVASPGFLDKHGSPERPQDLEQFDCIVFGAGTQRAAWKLRRGNKVVAVSAKPRFTANDFDFIDEAALAGLGVAMLPAFRCIQYLRTGKLQRVLPGWCTPETSLHAVYSSTRHLSPKVKVFLDYLRDRMAPPPWELGPRPQ